jgi:hypothetical protein
VKKERTRTALRYDGGWDGFMQVRGTLSLAMGNSMLVRLNIRRVECLALASDTVHQYTT